MNASFRYEELSKKDHLKQKRTAETSGPSLGRKRQGGVEENVIPEPG
jgi:hypothetical protein